MTKPTILVLALAALVASGCSNELPPTGQFVLYVSTDAPVPNALGLPPATDEPIPLFDTVRFDLFLPDGSTPCSECTRSFGIDEGKVAANEVSIGIVPADPSAPGKVRVRLYVAEMEPWPEPSVAGSIDAWVELPAIDSEGVYDVTVKLPTDAVGTTLGEADYPILARLGLPDPDWAGSWPPAQRVDCEDPPAEGMACVPGGAYWMGNPKFGVVPYQGEESDQRRIAVLSPFYVDTTEVTVERFRDSGLAQVAGELVPGQGDPVRWDGSTPEASWMVAPGQPAFCTFTAEPDERDDLPVTCLSRDAASAFCAQNGRVLPSEAQLEYLMGGMLGTDYTWGREPPRCGEAVFGRAFVGQSAGDGSCRLASNLADAPAPLPPGSGSRDAVDLGGVTVFDLTGNVSEWARDQWSRQDEPCWGAGVLSDPLCVDASLVDEGRVPCKGGNWTESPQLLATAKRWGVRAADPTLFDIAQVGFRCARPAVPAR